MLQIVIRYVIFDIWGTKIAYSLSFTRAMTSNGNRLAFGTPQANQVANHAINAAAAQHWISRMEAVCRVCGLFLRVTQKPT
ncbi:hypothetical protein ACFLU6_12965 [Acidobacteriota bacterium]